jgi:toxin ParE1/3/4
MKLRIEAEAESEAEDAAHWYEARRQGLGVEFLAAVDNGIRRIQKNPERYGRLEYLPDEQAIRRLLLKRFPFAIVYEILTDEIHVMAIAHTRRRPGYWKRRR